MSIRDKKGFTNVNTGKFYLPKLPVKIPQFKSNVVNKLNF